MQLRAAAGLGAAVLALAVVAALSPDLPRIQVTDSPAHDPGSSARLRQTRSPPASMVVCRGRTTQACARAAADRVGHPVAWLPTTTQVRATTLVAVAKRRAWANQDVVGRNLVASISSPGLGPRFPAVVRTIQERGTLLEVRVGPGGGLSLDWTHDRRPFRLTAATEHGDRPRLAILLRLWRTLRYTAPSEQASSSAQLSSTHLRSR